MSGNWLKILEIWIFPVQKVGTLNLLCQEFVCQVKCKLPVLCGYTVNLQRTAQAFNSHWSGYKTTFTFISRDIDEAVILYFWTEALGFLFLFICWITSPTTIWFWKIKKKQQKNTSLRKCYQDVTKIVPYDVFKK